MKPLLFILFVPFIIACFIFIYILPNSAVLDHSSYVAWTHSMKESIPSKKTLPATRAIFMSMGDILIHSTVYNDAKVANGYDFTPMFSVIKPFIQKADIAFLNQETMIGGSKIGLSTYPRFNSPFEVGDALKDAGIHIVSIANNHTLDRGEIAIRQAISHWNKLGILYTGAYVSEEDKNHIRILSRNGIRFSFLAYTYGTNGIPIPKGKEYLVNLIHVDTMIKDIKNAKAQSDVVVLSIHFGNEYERMPNETQQELVKKLANAGADIIVGHHPHVLQPPAWLRCEDGRKSFVIYSLGNFLSGQIGTYRQIGGIIQLEVEKIIVGQDVKISMKNPSFLPTIVTKSDVSSFTILPLQQIYKKDSSIYLDIINHMKQWMPELKIIE